jgi:signal transduction histidine kinase
MAVPLVVKGAVAGAMTFIGPPRRRYDEKDLEFAESLAQRAALSVENARLYQEAQEALQARDEFLSIAAHEIRGPITSVHMAVQGLKQGRVSPEVAPRLYEIIEREDRRLVRFVNELLELGSIQGGGLYFKFEEVDLGDIVRDAASRLGAEITRSGSSLSITTEGRIVGHWDRMRLDEVVSNLLLNAINFGLGKPIAVHVKQDQEITTLEVRDQGIGIPPEMHERIFNPFQRAVSARNYGGLGLGLFIVRTIVSGLGGTVRVESQPETGSTFIVELPSGSQDADHTANNGSR